MARAIAPEDDAALLFFRQSCRYQSARIHERMINQDLAAGRTRRFPPEFSWTPRGATGADVAPVIIMSFAAVVDRVRADYMEMPGLELTLPQAVRLWTIGMDDCRFVIDALVDAGFLKWTARRTIVRTGADLRVLPGTATADIPVRSLRYRDKTA
jgi:hypothetical protein